MAAWGQTPATVTPEDVYVWPENHAAVQLFMQAQTCWRKTVISTMAGAQILYDGLDYTQVKALMDLLYTDAEPADTFARLLVMEREALGILNKADKG